MLPLVGRHPPDRQARQPDEVHVGELRVCLDRGERHATAKHAVRPLPPVVIHKGLFSVVERGKQQWLAIPRSQMRKDMLLHVELLQGFANEDTSPGIGLEEEKANDIVVVRYDDGESTVSTPSRGTNGGPDGRSSSGTSGGLDGRSCPSFLRAQPSVGRVGSGVFAPFAKFRASKQRTIVDWPGGDLGTYRHQKSLLARPAVADRKIQPVPRPM